MEKELTIRISNKLPEISRVADTLENFCEENNLQLKIINEFNLSLDELLTNIISYGYDDEAEHFITIRLILDKENLTAQIEDDAKPFNPLQAPEADITAELENRKIGGLGLHIVKKLMDSVVYEHKDSKNILTLKKHI